MSAWFEHLEKSKFCYKNYAIGHVNGHDVCQCGWMGPKEEPEVKGMTFGAIMVQRQKKQSCDGQCEPMCSFCNEQADIAAENRTEPEW